MQAPAYCRILSCSRMCLCAALVSSLLGACADQPSRLRAELSNYALQALAIRREIPKYPPTSLQRQVGGIAVAELTAATTGEVTRVVVLESPDAEIAEAVQAAVTKWRFDRLIGNDADSLSINGVLLFNFDAATGTVTMLMPSDELRATASRAGPSPPSAPQSVAMASSMVPIESTIVLDVRERREYRRQRPPGTVNIPLDELERRIGELRAVRQVVLDCMVTQERCSTAIALLQSAGVKVTIQTSAAGVRR